MAVFAGPTARRARHAVSPGALPAHGPAVGRRVLVADPCADTVETMAWLLRHWGHDVRTAGSGLEVLRVARAYLPDVILMELRLPGLDGCAVARRLRQPGDPAGPLLVAVTGYGSPKDRLRSRAAGFDHHLVKPVDPDIFRDLLATSPQEGGGR